MVEGWRLLLDTAVVRVLFLIPARRVGQLSVCRECEMIPYCDVGIIFNTRKTGGGVWCALDVEKFTFHL